VEEVLHVGFAGRVGSGTVVLGMGC
jgi:hypothetical protein